MGLTELLHPSPEFFGGLVQLFVLLVAREIEAAM
jgi:hypothetical protein